MHRRVLTITAALASALLLGGCAASSTGEQPAVKTDATQLTLEHDGVDEKAYKEALAQFPDEPPASVLTTSIPLAEVLHSLDIPLVGVPSSTTLTLPAALDGVPRIGNAMAPDVEQIVKLAPGLVVSSEASRSTIESSLADTGIPAAFLSTDDLADLKLMVKVLGTAFDRTEAAETAMKAILTQENLLIEHREAAKQQKVLVLIGTSDSFMVMNNNSFLGSLLDRAGADNVAVSQFKATETYSAVDLEAVIAAAPDAVLVLQSGGTDAAQAAFDAETAANPAWTSLPAYQADRITMLDYSVFGTGTLTGLEQAVSTLLELLAE